MSLWCSGQSWSSLHVQIYWVRLPQRCFCLVCTVFFLFCVCFLTLFFLSACFPLFLLLTGSIHNLSLSPEFYSGKGISRALDLQTGQAYCQKKTISCQDMSLLRNSWIFFNVSWYHDKQHTVHHKLLVVVYTQQQPSDPLAKFKLACWTSS